MTIATNQVTLPQGTINYRDSGEGEPLVFVHGFLVNGRLWEPAAAILAASGHRCIVPDWPMGSHRVPMNEGADLSPPAVAQLVADLIQELDLGPVTLVGNDSGGAVSQMVAADRPEVVGRLVLTNCDVYENFPPPLFKYLTVVPKIPGAMTMLSQSMRFKPLRRGPIAFGVLTKKRLDGDLLDEWVRPVIDNRAIRRDAAAFMGGSSPEQTLAAAEKLRGLKAPALFAWAPEDRHFKISYAERLADEIPDARIVRIDDAKTFVSLDQPERLAEAISAFVAETKPAAVA